MKDLDLDKRWLAEHLAKGGRGARMRLAKAIGLTPTQITRMANTDNGADPKNTQTIQLPVLTELSSYFNDIPPGLRRASKEAAAPPERKSRENIRVPILHRITAGRLKSPISQIPDSEIKWLTLSGLGHGDFVGYQLEGDSDSMDRIVPPGSTIIINRADTVPKNGKFYVFSIDGDVGFKMWQDGPPPYFAPHSWNGTYKPEFIKRRRDLEIIGRVRRAVVDL